jgi:hypothetical protein
MFTSVEWESALKRVSGNIHGVFNACSVKVWCARRGSNPQPSASEADALSN